MSTTPIVVFYFLYFSWLFSVAYLSPRLQILNIFTLVVALFYFVFLRQKGDFVWFVIAALIPFGMTAVSVNSWNFEFNFNLIRLMPIWLPVAWGTTAVGLRKFYKVMVG